MKIVSVDEMQAIEKSANKSGISYAKMMENAGRGIAEWIYHRTSARQGVVGLVGSGNNGGDTLIALKALSSRNIRTFAFMVKDRGNDPLIDAYINAGGVVVDLSQNRNFDQLQAAILPNTVILDGILGTGLKLPIRGALNDVMGNIHKRLQNRSDAFKIAIDCPSGVDCDTGEVSDVTTASDITLCMAGVKQGLLKHPARSLCGELQSIDIGITQFSDVIKKQLPEMIEASFVKKNLPQRPVTGHKGTFGTCLVLAGSQAYTGAAYLTGKAAYRAGCGLVNIGTLGSVQASLAGQIIEAVWTVLPGMDGNYDPEGIDLIEPVIAEVESLVVGPGWGMSDENARFLRKLLQVIPDHMPTLFDADGLKLLKKLENWWELVPEKSVLTPHPGEMSVLTGLDIDQIQANRWGIAQEYANRWQVSLLLKGAVTVVAAPEDALFINPVSEPALATAGSGDVLSGVIGGLLAQGVDETKAAALGAWLHGRAGEIARDQLGSDISVTAMDILEGIPTAFKKVIGHQDQVNFLTG